MSGFLSDRYLKFLETQHAARQHTTIDHDHLCAGCGYNLRGKHFGELCPECGALIELPGAVRDELLAGSYAERSRFRAALSVAFACLVGAVAARLAVFAKGFTGLSDELRLGYVALGLALALSWAGAAWALTPRRLGLAHPPLRTVGRLVRVSQLLWPVAYVCWLVSLFRDDEGWYNLGRLMRLVAGAGAILLAWELWWLAERAEREHAARRLNIVVWLLAPVTLLPQVFPQWMPWYLLTPLGIFLLLWVWVMLLYALGVLELHRHVRWAMADQAGMPSRNQRVAQTRQALERQVERSLRPLPPVPPDMPLAPRQGPEQD